MAYALSSPRTDAILSLHAQRLTLNEIAAAVPCGLTTVRDTLKRHGRRRTGTRATFPDATLVADAATVYDTRQLADGTSAAGSPDPPPWIHEIVQLRRQGLSQPEIARRTGRPARQVGEALTRYRARWRHDPKRRHEAEIFALACEALQPAAKAGVAVALTAAEVAIHVDALRHVVSRLIVPERDPAVYREALAALTEAPAIPVELVLGDFWDVAARTPDPIAFLDYDGMGLFPDDLPARLGALADRLTDPAVIRLTASLAAAGGERQLPLAIDSLRAMPGRGIVRLHMDVTPWDRPPRMLTVAAVMRATPPEKPDA
jgi:hypothetical protein